MSGTTTTFACGDGKRPSAELSGPSRGGDWACPSSLAGLIPLRPLAVPRLVVDLDVLLADLFADGLRSVSTSFSIPMRGSLGAAWHPLTDEMLDGRP